MNQHNPTHGCWGEGRGGLNSLSLRFSACSCVPEAENKSEMRWEKVSNANSAGYKTLIADIVRPLKRNEFK